jgi:murein DD-endopeptidase MepM/ murein hydrolase activator NlpD
MCKAVRPFDGFISQRFGENKSPIYQQLNLPGHPGIDFVSFHWAKFGTGDTVRASTPGVVYDIINATNPDPTQCKEIRTIYHCEEHNRWFVVKYSHFASIAVAVGQTIAPGDTLGVEGNTGNVYAMGHAVTPDERVAGAGTHLHEEWIEIAPATTDSSQLVRLWTDNSVYQTSNGITFATLNTSNGYGGAFDWSSLLEPVTPDPTISGIGTAVAYVANAIAAAKPETRTAMVYRVCRDSGLPATLAEELWATIAAESGFNPNARNDNRDSYGTVVSTDYGLCQLNSHWYIGADKDVKTPFEALTNPEKCVRVMANAFANGHADDWIAHRTGSFRPYLPVAQSFAQKVGYPNT